MVPQASDWLRCRPGVTGRGAGEHQFGAGRVAKLSRDLGLDLPDALAGHVELLADFLVRVIVVHVDPEAHVQGRSLAWPQGEQGLARGGVDRGRHPLVFDEVAQVEVFVVADRGLPEDRLIGDLQRLVNLVLG